MTESVRYCLFFVNINGKEPDVANIGGCRHYEKPVHEVVESGGTVEVEPPHCKFYKRNLDEITKKAGCGFILRPCWCENDGVESIARGWRCGQ